MILIPWITNVSIALQGDIDIHESIVSASSPVLFSQYLRDRFDPKKNQIPCLLRYVQSSYVLYITHYDDIPMRDLRDPDTGKFLVKYGTFFGKSVVEIS